jgi:hypothetical protein
MRYPTFPHLGPRTTELLRALLLAALLTWLLLGLSVPAHGGDIP